MPCFWVSDLRVCLRTLCVRIPRSKWLPGSAICLALMAFPATARAQDSSTGVIRGPVFDVNGGTIGGATVALVNAETGFRYSCTTDREGRFVFDLLPPGEYSGRATAEHMSPQITPKLRADIGGITTVEFRLPVAGVRENITVSGAAKLVETQPSVVSSLIDESTINGVPLNGRRFTDLALLTPGVTQDPRGLTSGSNGDLAFGGIRGFQSSYLVDGGDNNNAFFSQATGGYRAPYQFSNEVVQEFRVSANIYGPELGRAGGAVVNVVTKSGSNRIHGSDFYFLRNSTFDARHPFLTFKPHDQQQQFGFTLGGPIRRNRVFFFAGLDQHIFHLPSVVRFVNGGSSVVPAPATGPVTPGDYESSDQSLVFAAAAQLSRQAGVYPANLIGNAGFLKFDFALSPRHVLALRLNESRYWGSNNVFLDPASPLTTYGASDNGQESVATETASASLTSQLSFHVTSHLRAQFSRDLQWSTSNSTEPLTKISAIIDGFGRSLILPRETREHRFHLAETFSFEAGRNSWKFGGDALLTWIYNFFPSRFGGEYIFNPIKVDPFTFEPRLAGLELTPLRAFAHQVPRYYMQDFGSAISHPNTNEYAAFLQDTIRVSKHLALSLGARYDLQTFTAKGLKTNPLWPDSGRVPMNPDNFAPRAGFAYSFGEHRPLVLRGGYGLFYTRVPQIYNSTVQTRNGISNSTLYLKNTNFYDRQILPSYPNALVNCPPPPPLRHFANRQPALSSF
ncbi:MAG: hypothetical protein QOD84_2715 [Acidobacteriaceae bacterium]